MLVSGAGPPKRVADHVASDVSLRAKRSVDARYGRRASITVAPCAADGAACCGGRKFRGRMPATVCRAAAGTRGRVLRVVGGIRRHHFTRDETMRIVHEISGEQLRLIPGSDADAGTPPPDDGTETIVHGSVATFYAQPATAARAEAFARTEHKWKVWSG